MKEEAPFRKSTPPGLDPVLSECLLLLDRADELDRRGYSELALSLRRGARGLLQVLGTRSLRPSSPKAPGWEKS